MLFFIIGLCGIQGDLRHAHKHLGLCVRSEHKGGVAIGRVPALERVERIRLLTHGVLQHGGPRRGGIRPLFGIAAGDDIPFCIDHTDGGLCGFAELEQYALKHTT